QVDAVIDDVNPAGATVVLPHVIGNPVGNRNNVAARGFRIQAMFEPAREKMENSLAQRLAAREASQRAAPCLITDMSSDDVSAGTAVALVVHDIEAAVHQ